MKTFKIAYIPAVIIAILFSFSLSAQKQKSIVSIHVTDTFKVSGNCEMCKKRIEKAALEVKGVKNASWDMATQQLTVTYNSDKTTADAVGKSVAEAGYDNDKATAPADAYKKLPACCQYTGKK